MSPFTMRACFVDTFVDAFVDTFVDTFVDMFGVIICSVLCISLVRTLCACVLDTLVNTSPEPFAAGCAQRCQKHAGVVHGRRHVGGSVAYTSRQCDFELVRHAMMFMKM